MITGAGRKKGLGAGIARRFAEEGAQVIITDVGTSTKNLLPSEHIGTLDEMKQVAELISSETNQRVDSVVCDVTSEESVCGAIDKIITSYQKIDIVVNNAGVGFIMKPLVDLTIEEWDIVLNVNLRGAFLVTKHVSKRFIEQANGGRIINIASQAAKSPAQFLAHYTSSKHGLVGLTRTAALELGEYGITVNAICPNHVTTDLGAVQNERRGKVLGTDIEGVLSFRKNKIPLGRVGKVNDTANTCVFLASDYAEYITGESINVSGGEEMH
ncbi:MAG: hypothetical protein CBC47_05440 [Alphaproteobacteria bacterium TMED87]|nr:oxidoreductase [Rhodospirillaceae bacterium]OUV09376.1 MAG: hypothetical protein CBC47_05440 [Alphaproteobacteria bacterium TMED87]